MAPRQLDTKAIAAAKNWAELQKLVSLDEAKAALKGRETNRLAHKSYYLKRSLILAKAKAAGITAE